MNKIWIAFATTLSLGMLRGQNQQNTLNTTGNVGVGTTNPSTPLEVVGQSKLRGVVAIDSSLTIGDSMVVERDVKVKNDLRLDGKGVFEKKLRTKKSLVVDKDARIKRDIIMEDYASDIQDFGILFLDEDGKTYPVAKSDIQDLIVSFSYAGKQCLQDQNGNTVFVTPTWHNQDPHTVYTGVGNCERNAIVGVNTANPQGGLHIQHETNLANNILVLERDYTGTQPQEIYRIDNNGHTTLQVYDDANNPQVFRIRNATDDFTLLELDQEGLMKAREIKVNMDNWPWPDYVFEEGYVLMPLSEVEKYIEENGHLPNVKSAEEIEKEGLNLGETNKILMEKMEEMTLYMIELEKKVKALEEKLNEENK